MKIIALLLIVCISHTKFVVGFNAPGVVFPHYNNVFGNISREHCSKAGLLNLSDDMNSAVQQCYTNISEILILFELLKDPNKINVHEVIPAMKNVCERSADIINCVTKNLPIADKCFDEKSKATVQYEIKLVTDVFKEVCFKNGTTLARFVADNVKSPNCFTEKFLEFESCLQKAIGEMPEMKMIHDYVTAVHDNPSYTINGPFSHDICYKAKLKMEVCLNSTVLTCNGNALHKIVEKVGILNWKYIPCANVTDSN